MGRWPRIEEHIVRIKMRIIVDLYMFMSSNVQPYFHETGSVVGLWGGII